MLLVSRRTTLRVDMHCGANTYHASSDKAVGKVHELAMMGVSDYASSSPLCDSAYTVPSAPTATSRAARPGTSAMQICQLKPIGANTYSRPRPRMPAML